MNLEIEAFGPLIGVLGAQPIRIEAPVRTAAELMGWLKQTYPDLAPWDGRIACAVEATLLRRDDALIEGSRIALIPPVSGG